MKSRKLGARTEVLLILLLLLAYLLAALSLYGLDSAFPLRDVEIPGDAGSAAAFRSDGELLVYACTAEEGMQLRAYLLHPLKPHWARPAMEAAVEPGADHTAPVSGFWFRYTVDYDGQTGVLSVGKQLQTQWVILLAALSLCLVRLVYGLVRNEKKTA